MSVSPGFNGYGDRSDPEKDDGSIEEFAMTSDEAVQRGRSVPVAASDYVKHGVLLVRIVNVNDGKINTDNLVSVSQEKTSNLKDIGSKSEISCSIVLECRSRAVVTERESGWLLSVRCYESLSDPAIDVKFLVTLSISLFKKPSPTDL